MTERKNGYGTSALRAEADWSGGSHDRNAVKREQARSVRKKTQKMGLSSNQARFLSLTARQVDLEHRIQQICQRRLRLTSELENVATSYNNKISNRKMYTQSPAGMQQLSVSNLAALGYKVIGLNTDRVKDKPVTAPIPGQISIDSQDEFINYVTQMNSGIGLGNNYILNCDIDLSGYNTNGKSLIDGDFSGTFDGNSHIINGLNINTSAVIDSVGMFSEVSGTVKNVDLENVNINAAKGTAVGSIAGYVSGVVDNCMGSGIVAAQCNVGGLVGAIDGTVKNSTSDVDVTVSNTDSLVFSGEARAGGFVGTVHGTVTDCASTGDVTVVNGTYNAGGFSAVVEGVSASIQNSYSTGSVTCLVAIVNVGGFSGGCNQSAITNCYTTSAINAPSSPNQGGFNGDSAYAGSQIRNCYAANTNIVAAGAGGFGGSTNATVTDNSNFYMNDKSSTGGAAVNGNVSPLPTGSWGNAIWDKSTTLPTLPNAGYTAYVQSLDEGLRNGTYSIAREADEFTQEPITINGEQYEEIDWRANPEIFDELYKGDDVEAENKYDKTVDEINSQDKKLQLEQTTIEVEYKAISSERESVKKILDTNAQSSFKYFS